jgi:hypothetical protein
VPIEKPTSIMLFRSRCSISACRSAAKVSFRAGWIARPRRGTVDPTRKDAPSVDSDDAWVSTTEPRSPGERISHAGEAVSDVLAQELRSEVRRERGKLRLVELDRTRIAFAVWIVRREHEHVWKFSEDSVENVAVSESDEWGGSDVASQHLGRCELEGPWTTEIELATRPAKCGSHATLSSSVSTVRVGCRSNAPPYTIEPIVISAEWWRKLLA